MLYSNKRKKTTLINNKSGLLFILLSVLFLRNVILHTYLTGSISCDIYYPPIVVEIVSLGFSRKMTAGGKMEHLTLLVAYELIGR